MVLRNPGLALNCIFGGFYDKSLVIIYTEANVIGMIPFCEATGEFNVGMLEKDKFRGNVDGTS